MANDTRTETLRVRLAEREKQMLIELAEFEGLAASQYIRRLIHRLHAQRFGRGANARQPKQ